VRIYVYMQGDVGERGVDGIKGQKGEPCTESCTVARLIFISRR